MGGAESWDRCQYGTPFVWDGRYFVTLELPSGRVVRQDASLPLPAGNVSVRATDNGMQGRGYYRAMLKRIRAEVRRERAGKAGA